MNLRDTILAEHSKSNCNRILKWVGNKPDRFNELFRLFLRDKDPVVVQRAAWPVSCAVIAHPAFIQKHIGDLLKNVTKPGIHEAVKRNTVRLLQAIDIPGKYHGMVMNLCFDYILSPKEKPATKAFSLTVLENLSKQYPEIKSELRTVIEDRWDLETAAFHSRASKILARLEK